MRPAVVLATLLLVVAGSPAAAAKPATIPALREWRAAPGAFELRAASRILVPVGPGREPLAEARLFAADIARLTGRRPEVVGGPGLVARAGDLELRLGSPDRRLGREGYRLEVGASLRIDARAAAGAFYGTRTVLQLLARGRRIPAGVARDWPRYPERGLMLDNGRRYFTPGWIRHEIRELAYLKLNQLHLHFSDNQGFRIASSSHPEVVSSPHLTKRQVRGIVELARRHHIRVIPEIDMPGHLGAALADHPELQLADALGTRRTDKLDVTLPKARRFARDLILEYLRLFPGRYWHAGADEYLAPGDYASFPQLERHARARYGSRATAADAYLGFIDWVDRLVSRRGRTLRVWHDGLAGGRAVRLRRRVVVEWWADHAGPTPRELLRGGHRILNAGWFPTYYVVGPLGQVRPSMRIAYESWAVNRFGGLALNLPAPPNPFQVVAPRQPRNLGSELHVWNDDPDGETAAQTERGIAPRLRVLAQKTWDSPRPARGYAGFLRLGRAIGRAPGFE
ncbi:MAG TPA: beta-N-acetylhexosaminidase [Thermoleophilaceae bacterium]|nr:beta-N-acetylhexosaminidase [Thermoleophilaceae bacterium]